jgi:hypothetical protein
VTRFCRKLTMLGLAWVVMIAFTFAADTGLIEPGNLIVDRSLPRAQVDAQVIAARRYDTFWNTGDEDLARAALAPGRRRRLRTSLSWSHQESVRNETRTRVHHSSSSSQMPRLW